MLSFSSAVWLAAAFVAITEVSSLTCYSSGLYFNCAHTVACQDQPAYLQCGSGRVIRVHAADYGRHDYSTCSARWSQCQLQNVFCSAQAAVTYRVAQRCNGRQSCSLRASNSWFGDPCPGTAKYLEVSYFCEPLKVICEGRSANIHCAQGRIHIHGADYGRRYSNICPAAPFYQRQNTDCTSSTPTYNLVQMCNGKSSCIVRVNNSEFGDPCPGTYKYLHLSFYCIQ